MCSSRHFRDAPIARHRGALVEEWSRAIVVLDVLRADRWTNGPAGHEDELNAECVMAAWLQSVIVVDPFEEENT